MSEPLRLAGSTRYGISMCLLVRDLYETEKSLMCVFFTGFYFRVIVELSCTQETSDWPKEKPPGWSFCTMGAGAELCVTLSVRPHRLESVIAQLSPNTSLYFS